MKVRFFKQLSFRVGAAILSSELLVLAGMGMFVAHRLSLGIEDRLKSHLANAGQLLARGVLDYRIISDSQALSALVGEEVSQSFLAGPDGTVYESSDASFRGKHVSDIPGFEAQWLIPKNGQQVMRAVARSGGTHWISITPISGIGGRAAFLFGFIEVSTERADAEKRSALLLMLAAAGSALILTSVTILTIFHATIARRIYDLVATVRFAGQGDLAAARSRLPLVEDEIGVLQLGINSMADSLSNSVAQLHQRITELQEAQSARIETENRLRAILDTSPAIIYLKNTDGQFIFVNRQFCSTFDVRTEDVAGRSDRDLFPATFATTFRDNDHVVLETRLAQQFEERVPQSDGIHVYMSVKFPLLAGDGTPYAICGISTDVTYRRRAEDELRNSNQQLQQFAYAVAHDLQEPLRNISIFSELLNRELTGRLDARTSKFLEFSVDGAHRMQALVGDLLTYTRVLNDSNTNSNYVEAALAYDDAIANLRAAIEESNAVLERGFLPTVAVSRIQLQRLFQNLIGNALKYRSDERPRITVSAELADAEWRFCVQDNGIGIAPQYSEQIFGVFKRLHDGRYPGTGIGLALCKRIVEHAGGRIWVESSPGAGSRFYFTLPAGGDSL